MSERSSERDELAAAVEARRELGRDYEDAVLDSFLDRLDKSITARVDARVSEQTAHAPAPSTPQPKAKERSDSGLPLALVSLGAGIPISAIVGSGSEGSVAGLLVAWGGIVGVNFAYAIGRRRSG